MTGESGAYVEPTYTPGPVFGAAICSHCGAWVSELALHNEWHAALWAGVKESSDG